MRFSHLLSTASTLALVLAHPLFIVSVPTPVAQSYDMMETLEERQGLLDPFESAFSSAFGLTAAASSTVPPPTKTHHSKSTPNSVQVGDPQTASPTPTTITSSAPSSAPSTSSSSSISSSTSSSSSSSSSSTTPSSTSTQAPTPVPTASLGSSNSQPSTSSNSNGISPAGIAVAVIFPLAILILTAWLIFRYNPRSRAWWLARQERLAKERSYRDAIDGPNSSNSLRAQALGADPSSRRSILQSFFAPSTVKLGGGKEIRRKPVNWGADSTAPPTPKLDQEMVTRLRTPSSTTTTLASPMLEKPLPAARPKTHYDVFEMPANEITDKTSITSSAAPMGRRSSQSTIKTVASELPASQPHAELSSAFDERPVSPVSHISRHHSISAASAVSPMQSPRVTGLGIATPNLPSIPAMAPAAMPDNRSRALDAARLRAARVNSANSSGASLPQPSPLLRTAQQVQAVTAKPTMIKAATRGTDGVYRLS